MFAIFEQGGKQYKVSAGDRVKLEKIDAKEGEKLAFKQVLLVAHSEDKVEIGKPFVSVAVEAKVVSHGKADKIRVVKYKAKKRYHRVQGHRQQYTEVEILSIGAAKAEKKEVKEEVKAEKKAAPAKKVTEKAAAPKKVAAKKKTEA